jgi:energy-coupling factor transport system ATP-binding protein
MEINLSKVEFKYDPLSRKILDDIDIKISSQDEFVFILGHTGSGKSTVVQHMNALLLPTAGQVEVFGQKVVERISHPIKFNTKKNRLKFNLNKTKAIFARGNVVVYSHKLKNLRKHIGLVFQFPEYQLFESTVLKDVMFGPKNFGMSEEEASTAAKRALTLVGLDKDQFDKSPFNLSGGQMRRVAIAGILANAPDVIILDEPTVGLDPKGKEDLMELLTKIHQETHKTIIMISHDMNIVAKYAKRIIVMNDGKKVYDGSKRALFEDFERLKAFNLDLPTISKIAVELKNQQLISFSHLPLTKEELETVILGGDINE